MNENLNIPHDFDDLEKYAPTLASVSRCNPFGVPKGYFEQLEQHLSSYIKITGSETNSGFLVPENYFELLGKKIEAKLTANEIPANYFEELPGIIGSRIFVESLNKENPFTVPENYFNELPSVISSDIKLLSAKNESGLAVHENYFEQMQQSVLAKLNSEVKKETKVISLFKQNWRYVAAAASVALIVTFALLFNNKENIANSYATATPKRNAIAPETTVSDYLQANLDVHTLIEYASETEANDDGEISKEDAVNYLLENDIDVTNEI
jgi:hypothetical protein